MSGVVGTFTTRPARRAGARRAPAISVPGPSDVSIAVAASADDAREIDTVVTLTDTLLRLGSTGGGLAGFRFQAVPVANAATVSDVFIQFTAAGGNTLDAVLRIHAEANDDAPTFTTTANDISDRTLTTAYVDWTPEAWDTAQADAATRTPDLSAVLQEVVNRAGWATGQAVVFVISLSPANTDATSPTRKAASFDNTLTAPTLLIGPGTEAPPPPTGDYNLLGDEAFTEGVYTGDTLTWYQRTMVAITRDDPNPSIRAYASGTSYYNFARRVQPWLVIALQVFAVSKDLRILDECHEICATMLSGRTTVDGFLVWNDGSSTDVSLNHKKTWALLSMMAYVFNVNRAVASPAENNYDVQADNLTAAAIEFEGWMRNTSGRAYPLMPAQTNDKDESHVMHDYMLGHYFMALLHELDAPNTRADHVTAAGLYEAEALRLHDIFHEWTRTDLDPPETRREYLTYTEAGQDCMTYPQRLCGYPESLSGATSRRDHGWSTYVEYSVAVIFFLTSLGWAKYGSTNIREKSGNTISHVMANPTYRPNGGVLAQDLGGGVERAVSGFYIFDELTANMPVSGTADERVAANFITSAYPLYLLLDTAGHLSDVCDSVYASQEASASSPKALGIPAGRFLERAMA